MGMYCSRRTDRPDIPWGCICWRRCSDGSGHCHFGNGRRKECCCCHRSIYPAKEPVTLLFGSGCEKSGGWRELPVWLKSMSGWLPQRRPCPFFSTAKESAWQYGRKGLEDRMSWWGLCEYRKRKRVVCVAIFSVRWTQRISHLLFDRRHKTWRKECCCQALEMM